MHRRSFLIGLGWGLAGPLLAGCTSRAKEESATAAAKDCYTAFAQPASAAAASTPAGPPVGAVNVKRFGAVGNGTADDSAAVQRALDAAGHLYFPAGHYLVGDLVLRSNTELSGAGPASVLLQKPQAPYLLSANPGRGGTPDPAGNIHHLRFHHLKFLGQAGQVAFQEHVYLLNLNAVSDVGIDHCQFVAYVGDGIYLGSGNESHIARHNQRIHISHCLFDGVVKNNRNALTIIDGSDITIQQCCFMRSGQRQMPAGIDIEPNPWQAGYLRIRNIRIADCCFMDMGAMSMVCLALPAQAQLAYPVQDIIISNCRAYGKPGQQQVVFYARQGSDTVPGQQTAPLNLLIERCRSDGIPVPLVAESVKGLRVVNSSFRNTSVKPQLKQSVDCVFSQTCINGELFTG